MKNFIYVLLLNILLVNCGSDDAELTPRLWLQVQEIPADVSDSYSFEDLNIKVYKSKDDYNQETNAVYSGKLDASGELEITNGIEKGIAYYVDIYSDDNVLSNWEVSLASFDPNDALTTYTSNENSGLAINILLTKGSRHFVGTWNFSDYNSSHFGHETHDRTVRTTLTINKDFSVVSKETYNDKTFTVNYGINGVFDGQLSLNYIHTLPSESGYPYALGADSQSILVNTEAIYINMQADSANKLIEFYDYADEYVFYSK